MKLLYGVRSLVFYLGYAPIVVVFSLLSFTIGLLLPHRYLQEMVTWGNFLIVHWLRLTCGVRLRVLGEDNIPERPFVILSKHQSSWETYYLQRRFRPVSTILKQELLRIPFFGWGLKTTRPIAIDRSNPRRALREIIEQGVERLRSGNNVIVYPEGTRMDPGKTGNYGRSGAALAVAAGVPVLPVALNAGHCWPARRFLKYPGTITVVFGEPLAAAGGDSKAITAAARDWIEATQKTIG
jgi:1-acyl-sn-glycerol-3-phosphate acyltransferase